MVKKIISSAVDLGQEVINLPFVKKPTKKEVKDREGEKNRKPGSDHKLL